MARKWREFVCCKELVGRLGGCQELVERLIDCLIKKV